MSVEDVWKASSHSAGNGNCVETTTFYKSSRSLTNGQCVEVADVPDGMLVRDSKNPTGPVLEFNRLEWIAFIEGVKNGEFDLV
jgi:hypothetical protein